MSFSLNHYNQVKHQVLEHLNELQQVMNDLDLSSQSSKLSELINQTKNNRFQIVVVGEFSRGKSTFINALLGRVLLPSSARPTTTVLNKITYHDTPKISLHFHKENKQQVITEDEFKKLIAPPEPIVGDKESEKEFEKQVEYIKTVAFAEIGYPIPFCRDGVEIIDTPGTNDLDEAREEVTNRIIPQSDAAIFILSAVKILSASEMSFLKDRILANDIKKIFIVINFKDLLKSDEDRQKVMQYAKEKLQDVLGTPKIHLLAAKQALNARRKANGEELIARRRPIPVWPIEDTGFLELEEDLADFLQYDRGAVKLLRPIQRAEKIVKEQLANLQVERMSFYHNIDDLKERVKEIHPQIQNLKSKSSELIKRIEMEMHNQESALINWYRNALKDLSKQALQAYDNHRHLSYEQLTSEIESTIAPLERSMHEDKRKKYEQHMTKIVTSISQEIEDVWDQLNIDVQNLSKPTKGNEISTVSIKRDSSFASFLEEVGEDLEDALNNTNSIVGSILAGAGLLVTGIVAGIAWLFGAFDNRKNKLKIQLEQRFNLSQAEKITKMKNEWKNITKHVVKQYKVKINEELDMKQKHLETMLTNAQLEESDILTKLNEIKEIESKLTHLEEQFNAHKKALQQPKKVGVIK